MGAFDDEEVEYTIALFKEHIKCHGLSEDTDAHRNRRPRTVFFSVTSLHHACFADQVDQVFRCSATRLQPMDTDVDHGMRERFSQYRCPFERGTSESGWNDSLS